MSEIGCKYETETKAKDSDTGWQRTAILTIFRTLLGASFAFKPAQIMGCVQLWLNCDWPLTDQQTNRSVHGYQCIYNFITPNLPVILPVILPAVNPCNMLPLFSCLHSWSILFQKSLILGLVKGHYQHYSQPYFSKCPPVDFLLAFLSISPPTHILQEMLKEKNSKNKTIKHLPL